MRRAGATFEPVYPEIHVGERLYAVDLRADRPVGLQQGSFDLAGGKVHAEKVPDGLLVSMAAGKAFDWTNSLSRLRDACVRVAVTMLDPSAIVYAVSRCEHVGNHRSQYALAVSAGRRAARLVRLLSGEQANLVSGLTEWTTSDAIAPAGAPNEIEIRVQGPTIEGRVNGRRVVMRHDPVLGFGRAGLRFEAEASGAARVLWWGFDTCVVTA